MKPWLTTLLLTSLLFQPGCGESQFNAGDGKNKRAKGSSDANGGLDHEGGNGGQGGNNGEGGNDGSGNGNNNGGSGSAGDDIFGGDTSAQVPTDCKNQSLLILDFKSGWWEGDGGDTFRNVIMDELKSRACTNGASEVEYHHILLMHQRSKFYDKDFSTYTQVWILSGSELDLADIRVNDPGLIDVANQIKTHKPALFFGAGFGSIDHVNMISSNVVGKDVFTTDAKTGSILEVSQNGKNVKIKTRITPLATGNLFTGISGQIVDHVEVGHQYAASDEIIPGLAGLTTLANCQSKPKGGSAGKTVACVAVGEVNGMKMVLDSGLQRFYSLHDATEVNTKNYLLNIVRALSL